MQLEHPRANIKGLLSVSLPKKSTSIFCLPSSPPPFGPPGTTPETAMALHVLGLETAEPNMDEVRQAFKKLAIEVPNGACKKWKGSATMTFAGVPAHQIKRRRN